jgi:hypothetical protein
MGKAEGSSAWGETGPKSSGLRHAPARDLGEADAAEPGIPGLDHGQREGGRDGRIGRAAAFLEDGDARLRRVPRLGGDHTALAGRAGLGHLPVLRDMRGRDPGHGGVPSLWWGGSVAPS